MENTRERIISKLMAARDIIKDEHMRRYIKSWLDESWTKSTGELSELEIEAQKYVREGL